MPGPNLDPVLNSIERGQAAQAATGKQANQETGRRRGHKWNIETGRIEVNEERDEMIPTAEDEPLPPDYEDMTRDEVFSSLAPSSRRCGIRERSSMNWLSRPSASATRCVRGLI